MGKREQRDDYDDAWEIIIEWRENHKVSQRFVLFWDSGKLTTNKRVGLSELGSSGPEFESQKSNHFWKGHNVSYILRNHKLIAL